MVHELKRDSIATTRRGCTAMWVSGMAATATMYPGKPNTCGKLGMRRASARKDTSLSQCCQPGCTLTTAALNAPGS